MSPVNSNDVNDIISSFCDGNLHFKRVAVAITSIANVLDRIQDNKQQCLYLFKRSVNICIQLDALAKSDVDAVMQNVENLLK